MNDKQFHLQMVQGVINRLSYNSFLLKGWSVILLSGLLALSAKGSNDFYIILAYLPVIVFWHLDGYFLREERLFRKLYDYVRELDICEIDFSMSKDLIKDQVDPWINIVFSKTILGFYGALIFSMIIVMLIN